MGPPPNLQLTALQYTTLPMTLTTAILRMAGHTQGRLRAGF